MFMPRLLRSFCHHPQQRALLPPPLPKYHVSLPLFLHTRLTRAPLHRFSAASRLFAAGTLFFAARRLQRHMTLGRISLAALPTLLRTTYFYRRVRCAGSHSASHLRASFEPLDARHLETATRADRASGVYRAAAWRASAPPHRRAEPPVIFASCTWAGHLPVAARLHAGQNALHHGTPRAQRHP